MPGGSSRQTPSPAGEGRGDRACSASAHFLLARQKPAYARGPEVLAAQSGASPSMTCPSPLCAASSLARTGPREGEERTGFNLTQAPLPNSSPGWVWWATPSNQGLTRQRQAELYEWEASLECRASSRPARDTQQGSLKGQLGIPLCHRHTPHL